MKEKNSNPNDKIKAAVIEKKISELIRGAVESHGFMLWDVEFGKSGGEWTLAITIDKPVGNTSGSVSMDDCMAVYKAVDPMLDEADPIPGAYTLEVSSPGLNRELKTDIHLNQYTGKNIILKLYAKDAVSNTKIFKGSLLSFNASSVTVKPEDNEEAVFERKAVAKICADDDTGLNFELI